MRKLLVVVAIAVFAACGSGDTTYDTQDSLRALDSTNNAQSMEVDAANNMQRNSIDSMQQGNAAMDTAANRGTER